VARKGSSNGERKILDRGTPAFYGMFMRSVELFSGAGGLALGLEQSGFEPVALVEKNRHACATLRMNRPQWNVLEGNIQEIDFNEFSGVELVAGGPPCQPFSMGGKAKGYNDQRDMFPEAVRAVRQIRPKAFLFENVRGLLRSSFRNYVQFIRLQLTYPDFPVSQNVPWEDNLRRLERFHTSSEAGGSLNYRVTINLADAADYGVPQRRHRVFFVGFRSDVNAEWFFPKPTHSVEELNRAQRENGDYWSGHQLAVPKKYDDKIVTSPVVQEEMGFVDRPLRWSTVRDAITDLGHPRLSNFHDSHFFQAGARSYPGHTGSPLDSPSKALKAGDHGVPGGENMLRYENGKVRYFSIRESARIQTFPDDWRFSGSWTESMRQLGNAVPVELALKVAESVAQHIVPDHGKRRSLQSS